jgi:hypothetical protein
VEPEDPRVEAIAVQRCAHLMALDRVVGEAGLDAAEERLFEIYDAEPAEDAGTRMSALGSITKMPYDWSPARKRCVERTTELYVDALSAED